MPYSRKKLFAGLLPALAVIATAIFFLKPGAVEPTTAPVESADFQVWTLYDGSVESRTVRNIMSELWNATVVDIIPDGSEVRQGDTLVRFDASTWERDLPRLEREYTLARSDMDSLRNAKLPLELSEIETRLGEADQKLSEETQALSDSRELLKEQLISEQEIKQQEIKAAAARAQADSLRQQLELTRKYLHPATLERAKATLATAELELNNVRKHISNCVVRAPADGVAIYKMLPLGSDVRTIRSGDTVYKNQTFMTLPDMSNLVMHVDIPESDITRVQVGCPAKIQPIAYPDIQFNGSVESVGAMAQSIAGRPPGRKYFNVVIRIDQPDYRLRSGMTARAHILSYSKKNALLIPRAAVWWEGSTPACYLQTGSHSIRTVLKTGMANDTRLEVIEGVKPGDRVLIR